MSESCIPFSDSLHEAHPAISPECKTGRLPTTCPMFKLNATSPRELAVEKEADERDKDHCAEHADKQRADERDAPHEAQP